MRWLAIACGALTLSAAGCANLESRVRARAASDFHCSEQQLQIVDQHDTVFRVSGCGKEGTYVCSESADLSTKCKRADDEKHEAAGL